MTLRSSDSLFFRGFTERKPFPVYVVACIYTLFRIVAEKLVEGLQALCRAVSLVPKRQIGSEGFRLSDDHDPVKPFVFRLIEVLLMIRDQSVFFDEGAGFSPYHYKISAA